LFRIFVSQLLATIQIPTQLHHGSTFII